MLCAVQRPRRLLCLSLPLAVAALSWISGVIWSVRLELPSGALDPRRIASVRVLARDGRLLRDVYSREDGGAVWVPLERVAPHLIQATLASEDQRFHRHRGVDVVAMARALALDLVSDRVVSGGSTLTMQLCRMLQPAPRSLRAKLRESVLAYKLERVLSKDQILWLYLNRAPYGNGTFGVEAAAQRYLGKPAAQLSLAESALLAALPRSPAGYNPYRRRGRLLERQRYILRLMASQGRITAEQHRLALREPIAWEATNRPFLAPHLVQRVLTEMAPTRGVAIRATLDLSLQEQVEQAVRTVVARLRPRGVSNAAALVVDNASGDVLAYVGSADFWSVKDGGQNDGTLALRQPGSAIKPFTYVLALEQGKTPASLLRDLPTHFATDDGDYSPRNYDETFHGPVRLRVALGSSYNVPAVHTADFVGVERLLERLRGAGFRSLKQTARYYGLGLTLGNGEVTLQELVTAYAALARGGTVQPLRLVLEAKTPEGQRVALPSPTPRRVFDRRASFLVGHILADPMARRPAFGKHTPLDIGRPAAVKTGTSKDFRDNWTVGFTPKVTVGVWVGNFDGSSMHNVSGITGAGPLWADVMLAATTARGVEEPSGELPRPEGIVTSRICPLSGELVGPHCAAGIEELFVAGLEPKRSCTMHQEIALDRRNGLLAGACPPEHVDRRVMLVYPPIYRAWAASQRIPTPPTVDSPLCPRPAAEARLSIRFPMSGDRYFLDPDLRRGDQRLPLEASVDGRVREVRWLVDGRQVARAPFPYTASWTVQVGRHTIEAVLPDGRRSRPVTITVE
jgi:penicillin-binding protein 1C